MNSFNEKELEELSKQSSTEIAQRLHRINQLRDAELADHQGRCRTLDKFLVDDVDWLAGTLMAKMAIHES